MKVILYNLKGEKVKEIELPEQFNEEYRPGIIKRAVFAIYTNLRQKYGAKPEAGKRYSAKISRRRRDYKTAYGHGISRVPRKTLWRRGRQFGWVGALAPGTVGGRKAHPPKAEKNFAQKINKKERKKAIRSALAATANINLVKARGHKFNLTVPIIIESEFENIKKSKEVISVLKNIKLEEEIKRTSKRKIRAGKGKTRGRKYKTKVGPLIIVSNTCDLINTAKNIPGLDVCVVNYLNAKLLAPGGQPGRLTIFTENAINKLKTENLFKK